MSNKHKQKLICFLILLFCLISAYFFIRLEKPKICAFSSDIAFSGHVYDEFSQPIFNAEIVIGTSWNSSIIVRTDETGYFDSIYGIKVSKMCSMN